MPYFSLILGTIGRTLELDRFFAALVDSGATDYECIVVDQNPDDRLKPILAEWKARVRIRHLRATPGLSHARNVGLARATGEVLAFPDDDCWYPEGLLQGVRSFFATHQDYSLLSAGVRDEAGTLSGNRWVTGQCDLSSTNLFRTSVGIALFVRRSALSDSFRFDESLGVGAATPFVSGEDTDYVFRLLDAGLKGRLDRSFTVHHPRRDMLSGAADADRAYSYGCGMGRVIRKRSKFALLPAFVTYDLMRTLYSVCRGDSGGAYLCAAHGSGVFAGYVAPIGVETRGIQHEDRDYLPLFTGFWRLRARAVGAGADVSGSRLFRAVRRP